MHYMGGKARIAKRLASLLESRRLPGQPYIEPFVGAANVIQYMGDHGSRHGYDVQEDLILLLQAVAEGSMVYPETVSEEEYKAAKVAPPSALRGLIGFGCSFGGKWFGGYARGEPRNYAGESGRSLRKKAVGLQGVQWGLRSYTGLSPNGSLLYCDPPYDGTTGFKGCAPFDSGAFWNQVRLWEAAGNAVYVSEYQAPPDFECVWSAETYSTLHANVTQGLPRTERLFRLRDQQFVESQG